MEVLVAKHEKMSRYTKSEMQMISKSPVNVFEAAARSKANPLIKKGIQCGGEFKVSDVRRPLMKRQIGLSRKRFVVEESSSSEGEERKGENEENQARSSQAGTPTSLKKTRLDQSITGSNLRTTSGTCQHFSNKKRSFKRKFLYSDEEEGEEDDYRPPSLTRSVKASKQRRAIKYASTSHGKEDSEKIWGASEKKKFPKNKQEYDDEEEQKEHKDTRKSQITQVPQCSLGGRISERHRAASSSKRLFQNGFYYGEWEHEDENGDEIKVEEEDEDDVFVTKIKSRKRSSDSDNVKMLETLRDTREKKNMSWVDEEGKIGKSSTSSVFKRKRRLRGGREKIDSDWVEEDAPRKKACGSNKKMKTISISTSDGNSTEGQDMQKTKEPRKCHQCRRNDKKFCVPCTKCKEKVYCTHCIKRWYPQMSEIEFLEICPFCRGNCNCNLCLHSSVIKTSTRDLTDCEKVHHLHYLINSLLPFVKEIRQEQTEEIETESVIQGLPSSSIKIERSPCTNDERIFW
ncbi:hypothetical protein RJ640_005665 [Escallonia rubra]|uniref:RING-type domain-containing protein n=1 Tax=Escallonia rubra TaxID=112253 RepID=A0AA88RG52_9ASTE|nr:hypothetical protein RJ640_005665 [Escallonia rubra]